MIPTFHRSPRPECTILGKQGVVDLRVWPAIWHTAASVGPKTAGTSLVLLLSGGSRVFACEGCQPAFSGHVMNAVSKYRLHAGGGFVGK